jgi:methionyl-tRNA formyltransferase
MQTDSGRKKYRVIFLGYLWKIAECLHQSPRWNLLGVGLELKREHSFEAQKYCEDQNIPWGDIVNLKNSEFFFELIQNGVDLIVVGAFGQIIPKDILKIPRLGILNTHTSFLPYYKGGTPIEEQILRGDSNGGITIHWMTEKVDEGPIVAQKSIKINPTYYYEDIFHMYHTQSSIIFADMLRHNPEDWPKISQPKGDYNSPRRKKDAKLHWHLPSSELILRIRAFGGRGWCQASLPDGKKILVKRALIDENFSRMAHGQLVSSDEGCLIISTKDSALKILEWNYITNPTDTYPEI